MSHRIAKLFRRARFELECWHSILCSKERSRGSHFHGCVDLLLSKPIGELGGRSE